ncbi:MAG: hypothetical protein E7256_07100 [Lachnospiraceae bacterium]|nr:hypothetical protein [Lachnospiraceae bacterium]
MKFISSLLSFILACILLLSPSLTDFPLSKETASYDSAAAVQPASVFSAPLPAPAFSYSTSYLQAPASSSFSSLSATPLPATFFEDSLSDELLTLFPAHFTAHSIAASEEINGSLYAEELTRTHSVGAYNAPSYIGYFTNICNRDFLCSSLILNKESSYFLDCDILISLDLNDIIAAFPMHDIILDSTTDHLADVALKAASSVTDSLLALPDKNAVLSFSEASPSDLTISTKPSSLNILTINTLDTPGTLTIHCEKDSTLILRTSNKAFKKTLTITGVPKSLIILPTSDTFESATSLYGTILAPAVTITIKAPFYGTILCNNLISAAPLNGVTLSNASAFPPATQPPTAE